MREERNSSAGPKSLERRSFVKGIASLSAGFTAAPMLSGRFQVLAQTSSLVPPGGEIPPVLGGWGPFTPSSEAGQYLQLAYPASTAANELQISVTYTLWIPKQVVKVRGVIVHQHGAGIPAAQAGATSAYDLHWQALARKWNCALLGPSYHVLNNATDLTPGGARLWSDPLRGSDQTFLRALDEFAAKSNHPEIATAPWCLWGHSAGGVWSNVMTMLHPKRVVAVYLRSGTAALRNKADLPPAITYDEVYKIPTMTNAGVAEKGNRPWDGSLATFHEYRAQGAPIGFAPDPRTAHFCGDSRYLAIPFFDACLEMRLSEKEGALRPVDMGAAWLAPFLGDEAVPAREFKGNPKEAVWLPNAAVAKVWTEYVKTGTVGDPTPPAAPSNVRVTSQSDQANEITWEAQADFISGIGGFIVLRDGHGIARLPDHAPEEVFGRPLFQGLSFHDTPFAPLPQMRYVDISAKRGVKHLYTIIALNSAGVPSASSSPAVRE